MVMSCIAGVARDARMASISNFAARDKLPCLRVIKPKGCEREGRRMGSMVTTPWAAKNAATSAGIRATKSALPLSSVMVTNVDAEIGRAPCRDREGQYV